MTKDKKIIIIFTLSIFTIFIFGHTALADITEQIRKTINSSFADLPGYQEGSTEPEIVAGKAIGYLLSLLGVLFILLIIYGGFMWMTAAGNEEKVATAKKIITTAAVGLAVVLTSALITYWVLYYLTSSTGVDFGPTEASPHP